jgi:hypothetical protein
MSIMHSLGDFAAHLLTMEALAWRPWPCLALPGQATLSKRQLPRYGRVRRANRTAISSPARW